jgi:2-alkyl-3-oxoalkanoate reductase
MRIFLTGGTGLVGSHVAERLRERGAEVVALVRPTSDRRFLSGLGAELVDGDVTAEVPFLAERMRGCQAVIHAAALLYRRAPWSEYHAVNVGGTARVLEAAEAAGVGRALHVSSVAVYGGGTAPIREDDWRARPVPAGDFYARSKRAAEELAWRHHDEGRLRITTVRPVVLYGERDRLFTPRLARLLRWAAVPVPGRGRNTIPVVYAGNAADGIVAALESEAAVGRAYNLSQDRPLTLRGLLEGFGRALGARVRLVPIPAGPLLALAGAAEALLGVLPGVPRVRLRRALRLVTRDNPYDPARARRELGWHGRADADEAFARTAAWLRGLNGEEAAAARRGAR